MSENTETDDDSIKFKEESRLLLMKSSERINLDNGGVFLKSLIEEKMYSSQIDERECHNINYFTFIFMLCFYFFRFKNI